jgi:hypothetical protein
MGGTTPLQGLDVVYEDSGTRVRHPSDHGGNVLIPKDWPLVLRVNVEFEGRCILVGIKCDFRHSDHLTIKMPANTLSVISRPSVGCASSAAKTGDEGKSEERQK